MILRVTHLGHAGLKIETSGTTILVDPWFSPEGAFQASWFQYPDNAHLITPGFAPERAKRTSPACTSKRDSCSAFSSEHEVKSLLGV